MKHQQSKFVDLNYCIINQLAFFFFFFLLFLCFTGYLIDMIYIYLVYEISLDLFYKVLAVRK